MSTLVGQVFKRVIQKWKQYRYRFVPWIAVNMKNRSVRFVQKGSSDKLITDKDVKETLIKLFLAFKKNDHNDFTTVSQLQESNDIAGDRDNKYCTLRTFSTETISDKRRVRNANYSTEQSARTDIITEVHCDNVSRDKLPRQEVPTRHTLDKVSGSNLQVLFDVLGFTVRREPSKIPSCGQGVLVSSGTVPQGCVVGVYPGAIYYPAEPILLQSIGNQFIFRCVDSILIDGNDKGISKFLFRSCSQRDRVGPFFTCDMSWLTNHLINPLAIGQYVNNHNKEFPANVLYQEFDVPEDFPHNLRHYIPNVFYSPTLTSRLTRMVVLVSTRQIHEGEELFSSYFTVVQ